MSVLLLSGCSDFRKWLEPKEQRTGHANLPLVQYLGGPVLAAPRVVPIVFADDPTASEVKSLLSSISGSDYWRTVTAEYGVGALSALPLVTVSEPPTAIDNTAIATWLAAHIDSADSGWPAHQPNDLYLLVYPEQTSVTAGMETGCSDFGGYHAEGTLANGEPFPYAVIPACQYLSTSSTISHELIEGCTDPFPASNPAFISLDEDHLAWELYSVDGASYLNGGEIADLCNVAVVESVDLTIGQFLVQRAWSNRAAGTGQDPCVPSAESPYFNAAPDLRDRVILTAFGYDVGWLTDGIEVPTGVSRTVDVRLYSSGTRDDWQVEAFEPYLQGAPPTLGFQWDTQTGNDGSVLHLTISRFADAPAGGSPIVVSAFDPIEKKPVLWPGFVAN